MIRTASACVYVCEPSVVSLRWAPAARQESSRCTTAFSSGSVTGWERMTFRSSGSSCSPRRSVRAASSMARVRDARVTPPSATSAATRSSSRSPRCTAPKPNAPVE